MLKKISYTKKRRFLVGIITIILFFIPFFWFKPGELALGGDSSRLYFYDTWSYLKSFAFYSIDPDGIGKVDPNQYLLPFLFFLLGIKSLGFSSGILISSIDGLKIAGSFLFMYLIIVEILYDSQKIKRKFVYDIAGILAGLFYTFSPSVTENMKYALLIHNQVFLNPLIFYLLLKFLKCRNYLSVWFLLFITFIFSSNFTIKSAPPLVTFYPLAFLFLFFYVKYYLQKKIPWKILGMSFIFFLCLQAFQLLPITLNILDPGSVLHTRIAGSHEALDYFDGIRKGLGKVSLFLLLSSESFHAKWITILAPLIIITGFLLQKKKNSVLTVSSIFFFITLFLISANITDFWVSIYRLLFYLPGSSMLRNFSGQWQFVHTFFYALVIGQCLAIIFARLKKKYMFLCLGIIIGFWFVHAYPFIAGKLVNVTHVTTNVSVVVKMDPEYEETLQYISALPPGGKMLLFPLNDFAYQVVHGVNNGAYIGLSTVGSIAGMPSYAGYQSLDMFGDDFIQLAKEKDYKELKNLLEDLNIKYIFHNEDPKIYNTTFPNFPYGLTRHYLPDNQKDMKIFVANISDKKIYEKGPYKVYLVKNNSQDVYVTGNNSVQITYQKINPTKYMVYFTPTDKAFTLVFSQGFHQKWKAFVTTTDKQERKNTFFDAHLFETISLKSIPEQQHTASNISKNSWYIKPSDVKGNNTLIIEMIDQRVVYLTMILSGISFGFLIIWGILLLKNMLTQKK